MHLRVLETDGKQEAWERGRKEWRQKKTIMDQMQNEAKGIEGYMNKKRVRRCMHEKKCEQE